MSVSAIKVLIVNIMDETIEELANFTFSFKVNLAVLLVCESVESQRNYIEINLRSIPNKRCFRAQIGTSLL